MCWLPSGSSSTEPTRVGDPTSAIARPTASMVAGSLAAPGSSAPSPHTARSGGSSINVACRSMLRRATPRSSSIEEPSAARRTSTWRVATSSSGPSGTENGITTGAAIRMRATPTRASLRVPPPPPTIAWSTSAFTSTTTNVTPQTPATVARRTVRRLSTWDTPSDPHVNPPRGHDPRIQSTTVQSAARPSACSSGRPRRQSAGATSPNSAVEAMQSSTSATHASSPKSRIQ